MKIIDGQQVPEVGDVWFNETCEELLHITDVGENFISFVGKSKTGYFENTFTSKRFDAFTRFNKYLGKSKADINQLFDVQDD